MLAENQLSGTLSRSLRLLTALTWIDLSRNFFSGRLEGDVWSRLPALQAIPKPPFAARTRYFRQKRESERVLLVVNRNMTSVRHCG